MYNSVTSTQGLLKQMSRGESPFCLVQINVIILKLKAAVERSLLGNKTSQDL